MGAPERFIVPPVIAHEWVLAAHDAVEGVLDPARVQVRDVSAVSRGRRGTGEHGRAEQGPEAYLRNGGTTRRARALNHLAGYDDATTDPMTARRRLPRGGARASNRAVQDEQDLRTLLARWFEAGDKGALRAAFDALWARLPRPRECCRRLGRDEVEGVLLDELEVLLRREGGELRHARDPLAFSVTHVQRRLIDRLRKERRRERIAPVVALDSGWERSGVPSVAPDVEGIEVLRALKAALGAMTIDRRVAFLLRHAPQRIANSDWSVIASRHPPPPPERPSEPPGDEAAARLLNPTASVDAYRKNLQRALDHLAESLIEEGAR
jgi:DNA-directed RNA polymerase specialized sigma24 family protein